MAKRRMFSLNIIDTDLFLEMSGTAQLLYFHLCLRGDDDGFVSSPKRIMRMIGCSEDDMRILVVKGFIIPFDSGVCVIKHWRVHNSIRSDRYTATFHKSEKALLLLGGNSEYVESDVSEGKEIREIPTHSKPDYISKREQAMKRSSLPSTFSHKIRQAFYGEPCPVCGVAMRDHKIEDIEYGQSKDTRPTIQHNKPLSKGGEHEIGNISVICHCCNVSTGNNETDDYNSDLVSEVWAEITQSATSRQPVGTTGKVRLGKVSKEDTQQQSCREPDEKKLLREEQFEKFWKFYDHKKEKKKAKANFMKLSERQLKEVANRVGDYVANTFTDGTFPSRMHPSRYLNPTNELWNDDITPANKPQQQEYYSGY